MLVMQPESARPLSGGYSLQGRGSQVHGCIAIVTRIGCEGFNSCLFMFWAQVRPNGIYQVPTCRGSRLLQPYWEKAHPFFTTWNPHMRSSKARKPNSPRSWTNKIPIPKPKPWIKQALNINLESMHAGTNLASKCLNPEPELFLNPKPSKRPIFFMR